MSPHSSGLIALHLSAKQAHLPEYLAEVGFNIAQFQWGLTSAPPQVVVTDQALEFLGNPQLISWVRRHDTGLILIGNTESAVRQSDVRADIQLPDDATGREVTMAIELVAEISAQRRKLRHEREECERWIDLAMHDSLTRLPNRRAWDERLAEGLAGKQTLCICLVDVDFFKQINDRAGHNVGDAVLCAAARVLRNNLRSSDFVARLGGDEFGLILFDADQQEAEATLDRIRQAAARDLLRKHLPAPTLSAGFVLIGQQTKRDAGSVFAAAAAALQAAKHQHCHQGDVDPKGLSAISHPSS